MKIHEIIREDSWDDEDPERSFVNPLPIVDAEYEFDIFDDLDNMFLDEYMRRNNIDDKAGLGGIGKIIIAARKQYGNMEQVPINQIVAIEPYLYPKHLKALVNGENVKTSSEYPLLLKYDSRYIAADGNHRIAAALQRNETTVNALVLDLNKFEDNR